MTLSEMSKLTVRGRLFLWFFRRGCVWWDEFEKRWRYFTTCPCPYGETSLWHHRRYEAKFRPHYWNESSICGRVWR